MKKFLVLMTIVPFIGHAMDNQPTDNQPRLTMRIPIVFRNRDSVDHLGDYVIALTPTLTTKEIASAIKAHYGIRGELIFMLPRLNIYASASEQNVVILKIKSEYMDYRLFFELEDPETFLEYTISKSVS